MVVIVVVIIVIIKNFVIIGEQTFYGSYPEFCENNNKNSLFDTNESTKITTLSITGSTREKTVYHGIRYDPNYRQNQKTVSESSKPVSEKDPIAREIKKNNNFSVRFNYNLANNKDEGEEEGNKNNNNNNK